MVARSCSRFHATLNEPAPREGRKAARTVCPLVIRIRQNGGETSRTFGFRGHWLRRSRKIALCFSLSLTVRSQSMMPNIAPLTLSTF
jgi:hypothetical protein